MAFIAQNIVDHQLKELTHALTHVNKVDLEAFVQPASIDIPIGNKAYLVENGFLPFAEKIQTIMDQEGFIIEEYDLTKKTRLIKNKTYLIPILDVTLPKHVSAVFSPKSSIGRIDLMVRTIVDQFGYYDEMPAGSSGSVWLEVTPLSFDVEITAKTPLNQVRFFDQEKESTINVQPQELIVNNTHDPLSNLFFAPNKYSLSLATQGDTIIGYQARQTARAIDMSQRDLDIHHFFEPVFANDDGSVMLRKDVFYIFATREFLRIPASYSVEMDASNTKIGELRAHYAGFFDPGFGAQTGAQGVLEIRTSEDKLIRHGQQICTISIHENTSTPKLLYGQRENNYQGQTGPRLAKYFKKQQS